MQNSQTGLSRRSLLASLFAIPVGGVSVGSLLPTPLSVSSLNSDRIREDDPESKRLNAIQLDLFDKYCYASSEHCMYLYGPSWKAWTEKDKQEEWWKRLAREWR